ncbi:MAG: 16S rRNA processing protein RimM [Flavobacteriales bacterium]|nr:16S rRNA processing protein RimM [Flavobacteriales bacterium]
MEPHEGYVLGYVKKCHGYQGEVLLKLDADHPEYILNQEVVYIEQDGRLLPFFLRGVNLRNDHEAILAFEDLATSSEVEPLIGKAVFLPLETLPEKVGNDFYFYEVIGFEVIDTHGISYGTVTEVMERPGQPVLQLDDKGTERLVPLNREWVANVNRELRSITMFIPEGLKEVYDSNDSNGNAAE